MRHSRRCLRLAVLFFLVITQAAAADAPVAGEYQVKAAFLFNFAKFVSWPEETFATPESPIAICVVGPNPFDGTLTETIGERTVRGRPVVVRAIAAPAEAVECQIAFFADSELAAGLARRLAPKPVLTVGETDGFTRDGGIVAFRLEESRVRFEINPDAASRAGLRVSSQLLNLAKLVQEERK